jgi:hypothetical protein
VLSRYALRLEAGKARMKEHTRICTSQFCVEHDPSASAAGICRGNLCNRRRAFGEGSGWLIHQEDTEPSLHTGLRFRCWPCSQLWTEKVWTEKKKSRGLCYLTSAIRKPSTELPRCFQKESSNLCPSPKRWGITNQRGKCIVIYSSTHNKLRLKLKPFMHMKVYPILPPWSVLLGGYASVESLSKR